MGHHGAHQYDSPFLEAANHQGRNGVSSSQTPPSEASVEKGARTVPGSHVGIVTVTTVSLSFMCLGGKCQVFTEQGKEGKSSHLLRGIEGPECWDWDV